MGGPLGCGTQTLLEKEERSREIRKPLSWIPNPTGFFFPSSKKARPHFIGFEAYESHWVILNFKYQILTTLFEEKIMLEGARGTTYCMFVF